MTLNTSPDKISGCRRAISRLALVFLLLLSAAFVSLWWDADVNIREGREDLIRRIKTFREGPNRPGRSSLSQTPEPGNAADNYHWILVLADPLQVKSQPSPPPALTNLDFLRQSDRNLECAVLASRLFKRESRSVNPQEKKLLSAFRPLADLMRRGAYQQTCSWTYPFEDGLLAENWAVFWAGVNVANILAFEAYAAPPEEAVDRALELLVMGGDLYEHPDFSRATHSFRFLISGYVALEAALGRPLKKATYQRVITFLKSRKPLDVKRRIEADDLVISAHFCAIGGQPLKPGLNAETSYKTFYQGRDDSWLSPLIRSPAGVNYLWGEYRNWVREARALHDLPVSERKAAWAKLLAAPSESSIPSIYIKESLYPLCREEFLARSRMLALLAAAQLYRLEQGKNPTRLGLLSPELSRIDPLSDEPRAFVYSQDQKRISLSCADPEISVAAAPR